LYFEQFAVPLPQMGPLNPEQILWLEMNGLHQTVFFSLFSASCVLGWSMYAFSRFDALRKAVLALCALQLGYLIKDLFYSGELGWGDHVPTIIFLPLLIYFSWFRK